MIRRLAGGGMEFSVLGPLRVVADDGAEVPIAGTLQRTMLAVLLSRAGGRVPVDVLSDAMWPAGPLAGVAQKLHVHVYRLRQLLGADRILFEHDTYRLPVGEGELDSTRFARLADAASAEPDPTRAAELARAALALWHGTPFDGLDVPLLVDEAGRLAERRVAVVELRFAAELRAGRHAEVVGELTELVAADPLRERLCGLLMTALYRAGRQADALAVFRATRRALVAELGLEPGPDLRAIERQILAGEAVELDPAVRAAVPAQLPHRQPHFVGRDPELSTLDEWLAGEHRVCVLAGTAGVGKTALATRWAHRVAGEFPDGQLHVDLRGYGPDEPLTPAEALAGFLRAFGVVADDIPVEEAERAAAFRTLLDGRRVLVVLDNASSVEQVRPLLPGGRGCFVLVTSRESLTGLTVRDGANRLDLGLLAPEAARGLLADLVGERVAAEPDAVAALIERCARLPLALRIAAELIGVRSHLRIADFLAELATEQGRLDALDLDGDEQTSVRAMFTSSYRHLDPASARLFRLIGLHPRRDFDDYALAALAGIDLAATRKALDRLVRANLVERDPAGRLRMHDLLRAYVRELVHTVDSAADRNAALTRMFDYYLAAAAAAMDLTAPFEIDPRPDPPRPGTPVPSFPDAEAALRWLDTERDTLVALAALAVHRDRPAVTTDLAATLFRYLDNGGYRDEAFAVHQNALIAATAHGDRLAEARAVRHLGVVYLRLGDLDSSLDFALRAHRRYADLGERRLQAVQLQNLGWLYSFRGEYPAALESFAEALRLHAAQGRDSRHAYARTLRSLGRIELLLGRFTEAEPHLREAVELAEVTGDRRNECLSLLDLGRLCDRLGHLDEARVHMERASEIARDASTSAESAVHYLASVYYRLRRTEEAFVCAWRSLGSARKTGERLDEVDSLSALGWLCLADERPAEARDHYQDALAISAENGDRLGRARANAGLGDVNAALGDLDRARECWRVARDLYAELGLPEEHEVAAKLSSSP